LKVDVLIGASSSFKFNGLGTESQEIDRDNDRNQTDVHHFPWFYKPCQTVLLQVYRFLSTFTA